MIMQIVVVLADPIIIDMDTFPTRAPVMKAVAPDHRGGEAWETAVFSVHLQIYYYILEKYDKIKRITT